MYLFVYVLICLRTYKYLYVLIPLYIPELPTTDFCRYEWKSFGTIFRAQLRRNCLHVVTYHCEISNVVFCCCCSVTKLCPALCNPMDCSMPGFPVLYYLPDFVLIHVHWVRDDIQPSHPLSPLPLLISIFPSIMVFSNEFNLHVKWTKYWTFSFSINPSNKYSRLMSFRIDTDWLVSSPCIPRDSQESSPASQFESIYSSALSLLYGPIFNICTWPLEKL